MIWTNWRLPGCGHTSRRPFAGVAGIYFINYFLLYFYLSYQLVTFLKLKHDVKYVPIFVKEREGRQSNVKMKDGVRTLMLILNLSVLFAPLKFFLPVSFFLMGSSFVYFIIYSLMDRFHITSSMTLLFISGVLIFFMGILCEQISAVRRELNK